MIIKLFTLNSLFFILIGQWIFNNTVLSQEKEAHEMTHSKAPSWRFDENYSYVMEQIKNSLEIKNPDIFLEIYKSHCCENDSDVFYTSIIDALKSLNENNIIFLNQKDRFQNFLKKLRISLQTNYYKNKISEESPPTLVLAAKDIVMSLYQNVNITHYGNDLVGKMSHSGGQNATLPQLDAQEVKLTQEEDPDFLMSGQKRILKLNEALNILPNIFNGIKNAPSDLKTTLIEKTNKSLRGSLYFIEFDPHLEGSLNSLKFATQRQDPSSPLLCLRMATATIGSNCYTQIQPEFISYLDQLKREKKHHTYINFQNIQTPRGLKLFGIEDETPRAFCLQNLSENEKYEDTLTVITLAKNTDFYWQKGNIYGKPTQLTEDFIIQFNKNLFEDENSGYFFPKKWKEENSPQRLNISDLIKSTQELFFPNMKELSIADRKNFIEYTYLLITHYATKSSYSCNKTCKDGIDRAGAASAFDFLFLSALDAFNPKVENQQFNKNLRSLGGMIFADALMVQYREIKHERFERFLEVGRDFIKKVSLNPTLLNKLKEITSATGVLINLDENQTVKDPRFK